MSKKSVPVMEDIESALETFAEEIEQAGDRGAIIVGAAYLEDILGALLRAKLLRKDSLAQKLLNGSLHNAATRADLAYGLGLIGPTAQRNLKHIREIRNLAAHGYRSVSFGDLRIAKACQKLQLPGPMQKLDLAKTNRKRFVVVVTLMAMELMSHEQGVEHAKELKDITVDPKLPAAYEHIFSIYRKSHTKATSQPDANP